ncbi:MAG: cell division protein FtsA [Patescibacteria group bacterium]|jgi:cell division protein FtsA
MPKEEIIVGLDIGSHKIRTIVSRVDFETEKPQIIGLGESFSNGIRRGVVVDVEEATSSISSSIEKAERTSGVPIEHAFISVGGSHVISENSKGVIAVGRADNEITEDDVSRSIDAASAISLPPNHEILHVVPRYFIVDNQEGIKDPIGMNGVRLEVEAVIVEGATSYIKNLTKCIARAGIEIDDLIVSPLAASYSVLSKKQKELGVVLVDIGGGTTGLVVYEEGDLMTVSVLPIGSEHITNDLAIGLRTSIEDAERIKLEYGVAVTSDIDKRDEVDLSKIVGGEPQLVARKKIVEIIEARLSEMFSMIDKELRKIDRSGKLPAGIVLCGGGAKLPNIVDLAKKELRLPAQIGFPESIPGVVDKMDDPSYATPEGLIMWGLSHVEERKDVPGISSMGNTVDKIKGWFKTFLP